MYDRKPLLREITRPIFVTYRMLREDDKLHPLTFKRDPRVSFLVEELFHGRVDQVKLKGKNSLTKLGIVTTSRLYMFVFYRLLRLIARDVIDGTIVYFQKSKKSSMYIEMISSLSTDEAFLAKVKAKREVDGIPSIDFSTFKGRYPIMIFNPGYSKTHPIRMSLPVDLKRKMNEAVIAGKRYSMPSGAAGYRDGDAKAEYYNKLEYDKKRKISIRL